MNYKIREVDNRDFNFISLIMKDLYSILNTNYTENIFVVENEKIRTYIIKEQNCFYVYKPYFDGIEQNFSRINIVFSNNKIFYFEDDRRKLTFNNEITLENKSVNSHEIIGYQTDIEYYGYNGAILYAKLKDNKLIQLSYPYNIITNMQICEHWLKNPTNIIYDQGFLKKAIYDYCTIDTNFFTYLYQYLINNKFSDFIDLLFNLNMVDDMDGFYIKKPFKLGKTYTYEEIQKLVDTNGPSKELINIFNEEDEEINYYTQIIIDVLKYIENRSQSYTKIYLK